MKASRFALLVAMLSWFACQSALNAQVRIEEVRKQITKGFNAYRDIAKSIQGSYVGHNVTTKKGGGVVKIEWTKQVKQGRNGGILEEVRTTNDASNTSSYGKVIGRNSKYAFELKREKNGDWLLQHLQFDPMYKISQARRTVDDEVFSHISMHHQFLNNQPLASLLENSDFKISKARPDSIDDRPAVEIDFEFQEKSKRNPASYQGTITLDAEFWCILRCNAVALESGGGKQRYTVRNTIDTTPSGKGKITSAQSRLDYGPDYRAVENEFRLHYDEDVPESAFSLTAFGLPEAQGVVWDTGPRYTLWFALTGAAALLIALGFGYARRRKAASQHAP